MADHSFEPADSNTLSTDDTHLISSSDADVDSDDMEVKTTSRSTIHPDKRRQIEAMQEEKALNNWLKEVFDDD